MQGSAQSFFQHRVIVGHLEHLLDGQVHLPRPGEGVPPVEGERRFGDAFTQARDEIDLVQGASEGFDRERAIYLEEVKEKPAEMQEKITKGKLDKFFADLRSSITAIAMSATMMMYSVMP